MIDVDRESSESLCATLRVAETMIEDVLDHTDTNLPGDRQARGEIEMVARIFRKWRLLLHAGGWGGREAPERRTG